MEVFLIAVSTAIIAEMGDRTQLLSLVLSAKFRKPWSIVAGLFLATLANHVLAGVIGIWAARFLSLAVLNGAIGISMLAMAAWSLIPEKSHSETKLPSYGAFITTLFAIFLTEFGDKTQIATVVLAAGYHKVFAVVAGTTVGMLAADIPVIFLGNAFASRLPRKSLHYLAFGLFTVLGIFFITKALVHWTGFAPRSWPLWSSQGNSRIVVEAVRGI